MGILTIALNPTIDISSNVSRIQPTRKMRTFNQRRHAGGGGVNVARVIVELGGKPELLLMSGGATGALLEDTLATLPIQLHVAHILQSTRIAFMVHEDETNLEYRFVPEGPEVTSEELARTFELLEHFDGNFVVASGSLPRGAPLETYAEMAKIAARKNARFILDTSGEPLRMTLAATKVFLFKPSIGELEKLVGRRLDEQGVADAAMSFVKNGQADYVTVTMGSEGALMASAAGLMRLPARHVVVRSAVGAGDSFIGALVWFLTEGKTMEEAFRFGAAAGAAAVMTSGTELCRRADIIALYEACDDEEATQESIVADIV